MERGRLANVGDGRATAQRDDASLQLPIARIDDLLGPIASALVAAPAIDHARGGKQVVPRQEGVQLIAVEQIDCKGNHGPVVGHPQRAAVGPID